MRVQVRYVTRRVNRSGRERWYWQRPGHPLTRLPDNPIERIRAAERLNAAADAGREPEPERGSIAWVVEKYRSSDGYHRLAPGTLKYYGRFLREIEELGPRLPFSAWTRATVVDHIESYARPHQRRQCRAVLKNLFGIARYYGLVERDETGELTLAVPEPRDRIWSDEEIGAWLEAAAAEDPHMTTAFLLLQYTAQRPSDVLAMGWQQLRGDVIHLRQEKTGRRVPVPCHPDLLVHLQAAPRSATMIVTYRGRPVPYLRFNERFRRIAKAADVDAQARDLRRTGMVRMAEAGATVPQIASVSGHTVERTQRIIETYVPRTLPQARAAIALLPRRQNSNALASTATEDE